MCLLPASDARHDPSKPVDSGSDCFWQLKAPIDKDLRTQATGAFIAFTFNIENKCEGTDVEVDINSPSGSLHNWYCPFPKVPVPQDSSNTIVCYTHYDRGDLTLSRGYALRVVSVNGSIVVPVDLDPEVVLERAGSSRLIPAFQAREQP